MTNERARAEALNESMWWTLTDLESVLGVSHQTLLRYVKQGKLKCRKFNGRWRVTQEQLQDFINNAK